MIKTFNLCGCALLQYLILIQIYNAVILIKSKWLNRRWRMWVNRLSRLHSNIQIQIQMSWWPITAPYSYAFKPRSLVNMHGKYDLLAIGWKPLRSKHYVEQHTSNWNGASSSNLQQSLSWKFYRFNKPCFCQADWWECRNGGAFIVETILTVGRRRWFFSTEMVVGVPWCSCVPVT